MEIHEMNKIGIFLPIGNEPWWMTQWRWKFHEKKGFWPIGLPPGLVEINATRLSIASLWRS